MVLINGRRILSNDQMIHLRLIAGDRSPSNRQPFALVTISAHTVGDGTALHSVWNELFCILGGASLPDTSSPRTDQELWEMLVYEWERQVGPSSAFRKQGVSILPRSFESRTFGSGAIAMGKAGTSSQAARQDYIDFVHSQSVCSVLLM